MDPTRESTLMASVPQIMGEMSDADWSLHVARLSRLDDVHVDAHPPPGGAPERVVRKDDVHVDAHPPPGGAPERVVRKDDENFVDRVLTSSGSLVMKNDAGVNVLDDAAWAAHLASLKK